MNIKSAKLVYFSPTRTTQKIVESIAQGIQADAVEQLDLTPVGAKTHNFAELQDELAIIGAPVYSGRLPIDAVQRIQRLKANSTPAVIVVVYGNREYEDALLELNNLAVEVGFRPFAGGTFIGEHSLANDTTPIANGRPDTDDLRKARDFGKTIWKYLSCINALDDILPLKLPGNFPYKQRNVPQKISPITQEILCTRCKTCAGVCPTGAITVDDRVITDSDACILCCACVKNCPTHARVMEDPRAKQVAARLSKECSKRKEPEIYLSSHK